MASRYDSPSIFGIEQLGTGNKRPVRWYTWGQLRFTIRDDVPGLEFAPASADPAAPTTGTGSGVFFFRDRGDGKAQFCVRFPSGAIQIISTEP